MDPNHHAHLLYGDRTKATAAVHAFCRKHLGVDPHNSPDYYFLEIDTLGIDDSRDLRSRAAMAPAMSRARALTIAANKITLEAQNALLKLLEEPRTESVFFLIVPERTVLISTFLSRFSKVNSQASENTGLSVPDIIAEFISAGPAARLKLLNERDDLKTRSNARLCMDIFERYHGRDPRSYEHLALAKKYLDDQASSVKLLMEHLALVIPQVR